MAEGTGVITADRLSKRFGRVVAVDDLSFRLEHGTITGFLGRNGAGKSSTIKMLLGMLRPTGGSGTVLGRRIDDPRENREMRKYVAYVGEDKQMYAYMTVGQLIRFTRSFYADWRRDVEQRLLHEYQLPLQRKVKALSKGMRTKLALLLALSRRPELLILDEPSEGLDPVSIEDLLQSLVSAAAEGTAVFFSSHQISEVERIADEVFIMCDGRLALCGPLEELREKFRRMHFAFIGRAPSTDGSRSGSRRRHRRWTFRSMGSSRFTRTDGR